jgi:predicted nucleic acid-binding protein
MWLAMSGLFRARWSPDIHREWMAAVADKHGIDIAALEPRREAMDASVLDSCVTGYESLIPLLTLPDPNDRHVLAAAIRCGADAIVTFNERDFPVAVVEEFGIHVRHPDDFILDVHGLHQSALIEAAKIDLAHYADPPLNVYAYIDGLRRSKVPKTADYLEKMKVLLST